LLELPRDLRLFPGKPLPETDVFFSFTRAEPLLHLPNLRLIRKVGTTLQGSLKPPTPRY